MCDVSQNLSNPINLKFAWGSTISEEISCHCKFEVEYLMILGPRGPLGQKRTSSLALAVHITAYVGVFRSCLAADIQVVYLLDVPAVLIWFCLLYWTPIDTYILGVYIARWVMFNVQHWRINSLQGLSFKRIQLGSDNDLNRSISSWVNFFLFLEFHVWNTRDRLETFLI